MGQIMRIRFVHSIVVDRIEFNAGDEIDVEETPKAGEVVDITPGQLRSLLGSGNAEEIKPVATLAPAKKDPAKN